MYLKREDNYFFNVTFINMRKILIGLGIVLMGLCETSCQKQDAALGNKGSFNLIISPIASFTSSGTRSANLTEYNQVNNYQLVITDLSSSRIIFSGKMSEFSDEDNKFEVGNYEVKASYGEKKIATQDNFYVEGSAQVSITSASISENTPVTVALQCKPVCARVAVAFGSKMEEYFSDYYVTYSTSQLKSENKTALWSKDNTDPWYLAVNQEENILATIHVVRKSDGKWTEIQRTCALSDTKGWALTIDAAGPPEDDVEKGSLGLTISVDESVNDKPETIMLPDDWWM